MFKRFAVLLLALALAVCSFAGCSKKGKNDGYVIEQDKYLFGMGEMPNMGVGGAVDSRVTPDMVTDLTVSLGVKSFRIWMHLTSLVVRDRESNALSLNAKNVERYHDFIDGLTAGGVTHLTAMSHYYLYPYGFANSSNGVVPEPYSEDYYEFMKLLEECYALVSAEFPEIKYWEPSNETNGGGRFLAKNGYIEDGSKLQNEDYLYDDEDLASITADICYYANRGIKRSNPNNICVLPGMVFTGSAGTSGIFLEMIYESIESGELPRSLELPVDTNSDNYFQVLNWHPYVGTWGMYSDAWIEANLAVYQVAIDHGDEGKKVFLTEFGYPDFKRGNEQQENIARYVPAAFDAIKQHMPWVETVHMFRMFDWDTAAAGVAEMEKSFGLFFSPNNRQTGAAPKPVALSLFEYFNPNGDKTALYKYAAEE